MRNRPLSIWTVPLTLAIACAAQAEAATVTLGASKDAMIFGRPDGGDTGNASGMGPALFAGADASGNLKRSLIAFDVASALPSNAVVTNVTMTLYLGQIAGSGGGGGGNSSYPSRTFRLYDLQQAWTEGTSGSPTQASIGGTGQGYTRVTGDTSWDYASYASTGASVPWMSSDGTLLHGGNFASTESAASTFSSFVLGSAYTWSSAGMVADVQGWLAGTQANNGWLIKSDLETSPQSFLGFWSKDGAAANNNLGIAPSLTIEYNLAPVPEPMTVSLMLAGLAGVVAVARRRGARG